MRNKHSSKTQPRPVTLLKNEPVTLLKIIPKGNLDENVPSLNYFIGRYYISLGTELSCYYRRRRVV